MRVALISDIHANHHALTALSGSLDSADRVLCLGDLVGYYCEVNEVIDRLREMEAICVRGNHDQFLLTGVPESASEHVRWGIEHAAGSISEDNLAYLWRSPLSLGIELAGRRILLTHGSPWRPLEDYLYADNPELDRLAHFDYDVIGLGQTHRPLSRDDSRPMVINPGSVGQSRHRRAVACAALLDTASLTVTHVEVQYDPDPVMALARANGAGEWIAKHLAAGP
ncbi:MAG: metallophosphoesterase [Armatimonadia bacterium]|nr:metallophosphoesterase [Armatimonadia bacterium]